MENKVPFLFVQQLFPNFKNVYGDDHPEISIKVESVGPPPTLSITSDEAQIIGDISLSVMNPLNPKIAAAIMYCQVGVPVEFLIGKDMNMYIKLKDFNIQLGDFKPLFESKATKKQLQRAFATPKKSVILTQFNEYLKTGVKLPLHDKIFADNKYQIL